MVEDMICVLSDDSTFTMLHGCWIAVTTPAMDQKYEEGYDPDDVVPAADRYSLAALVNWAYENRYFSDDVVLEDPRYPKIMQVEPDTE
jgi:hypothetical protein